MRWTVALLLSARALGAECDSNVLISLDRSCSMRCAPDAPEGASCPATAGPSSKWQLALDAIAAMFDEYGGNLRFGLTMFPDMVSPNCEQDAIPVGVALDNEADILAALEATEPTGPCVTNIDTGVAEAWEEPAFALDCDLDAKPDPWCVRRGFVLLVTDGKQSGSCGGDAMDPVTEATIADLYDAGIDTFVVGFGGAVDPAALSAFALAGGVPRDGDPPYWQADTGADLEEILIAIGGAIGEDAKFGCPGLPCPDGRCFEVGEECYAKSGFCVPPAPLQPDAGAGEGESEGEGEGDGGVGGGDPDAAPGFTGDEGGGCGCALGALPR